jgi:hypothetical protein
MSQLWTTPRVCRSTTSAWRAASSAAAPPLCHRAAKEPQTAAPSRLSLVAARRQTTCCCFPHRKSRRVPPRTVRWRGMNAPNCWHIPQANVSRLNAYAHEPAAAFLVAHTGNCRGFIWERNHACFIACSARVSRWAPATYMSQSFAL